LNKKESAIREGEWGHCKTQTLRGEICNCRRRKERSDQEQNGGQKIGRWHFQTQWVGRPKKEGTSLTSSSKKKVGKEDMTYCVWGRIRDDRKGAKRSQIGEKEGGGEPRKGERTGKKFLGTKEAGELGQKQQKDQRSTYGGIVWEREKKRKGRGPNQPNEKALK